MSLCFPYLPVPVRHPLVQLGGRRVRPRAIIGVTLIGPRYSFTQDALLDTGADDTVFPDGLAAALGIDLTNAPQGTGSGVGQGAVVLRYAEVTLRIADNRERREWRAWVGFAPVQARYPLLGFAGFLQYFTATFFGDREEVELTINGLYTGT
jgi:hypothetical protein